MEKRSEQTFSKEKISNKRLKKMPNVTSHIILLYFEWLLAKRQKKKKQMWVIMWRKRNHNTVLVRNHTSTAIRKKSGGISQNVEINTFLWHSCQTVVNISKGNHLSISICVYRYKDTLALFTVAKIWNQPRWASLDDWIKKIWSVVCLYMI